MNFRHKTVHGAHQEIHFGKWRSNRFGVLSGVIERHRYEPFDAPDWPYLLPASAPRAAVPCVGVERDYRMDQGLAIYAYTYDGVLDGDNSFEQRIYCTLEGSDNEEPIETHPQFAELFKKYKGINEPGTQRFSHFRKLIEIDGRKQFNPLYGVTHFLTFGMIWTRSYVRRTLPAEVFARVDTIDKPRGHGAMQPPELRGKRNWLKLAPAAQQRQNYVTIAERWLASGRNGWNPDVYSEKGSVTA